MKQTASFLFLQEYAKFVCLALRTITILDIAILIKTGDALIQTVYLVWIIIPVEHASKVMSSTQRFFRKDSAILKYARFPIVMYVKVKQNVSIAKIQFDM